MQKKNYKIRFSSGELAGRSFVIPADGLLIGKSSSAAVRPEDSEIEPEHALLQIRDGHAVIAARAQTVFVNDEQLAQGSERAIEPGATVRLGKDLAFILEEDEGLPENEPVKSADAVPAAADDTTAETATEDDETSDDSDSPRDENAPRTRFASATELSELRTFAQRKVRGRKIALSFAVIAFLVILFGGFIYSEFSYENPVTWPGELTDQFNDGEFRIELPPAGKFLIYFPKCRQTRISESKDKTSCDVMTLLGKNFDVPFHLQLTVNTIPNGYIVPREKSFEKWKKQAMEKSGFTFLTVPEEKFYSPETSGYPYYYASYRRVNNKFVWQGFVCYLRYHNREIIFLREVPHHHYWRTERVLENYNCFVASPDARHTYWEIPDHVSLKKSKTELYKGLLEIMWGHLVTSNWQNVKAQFAELLSASYHQNDLGMAKDALVLWQEFRKRQQQWYSQECLAYQQCQLNQDMEGMIRIRNDCLRKFPDSRDCRHDRIIRNIWDIEL